MDYTPEEIMQKSIFSVKQDITLLSDNIVHLGGKKIKEIMDRRGLTANDVDYFLPHISSDFSKAGYTTWWNYTAAASPTKNGLSIYIP